MAKYDYLSIDDELHEGLPRLTKDEYAQLKANIVADGKIHDPVIVWGGSIVVDGRHRVQISRETGIEFRVEAKNFTDENEARDWIINRSLGRRNLTGAQRDLLIGALFNNRKKAANAEKSAGEKPASDLRKDFASSEVAKEHGVSKRTVELAGKVAETVAEMAAPVRKAIVDGDITPNRKQIAEIAELPKADQKAMVAAVKDGATIPEAIAKKKGGKKKQGKAIKKASAQPLLKAFGKLVREVDAAMEHSPKSCRPHHEKLLQRLNVILEQQIYPWMREAFGYEAKRESA